MPVDATWRIQSNSALVTATSSFTVSLPNPATDSSTLLLFIGTVGSGTVNLATSTAFDPPWFADVARSAAEYVWRRDAQPAGETSWTIPCTAVSATYYWRVEEWGGLSAISQPDANTSVLLGNSNPVSSNTATADVSDFAALGLFRGFSAGGGAWPSGRSYSSGWSEVAYLTSGTGTGATDFVLILVESYPGASGSVQATITWDTSGGGTVPSGTDAWVACYQPGVPAPPAGVLTS